MQSGRKQYFHLLSAIRGIAAVLVVIRHTHTVFNPIVFPMSFMAVDIFFLLSGVVIEASYGKRLLSGLTSLHFTLIRIVRIYPLFILGCSLTLLTVLIAPDHRVMTGDAVYNIPHKAISWCLTMFLLPNLFFKGAPQFGYNHPGWSLFFELAINVFYALIVKQLSTGRLVLLIGSFGVGLLLCLILFRHYGCDLGWTRKTFVAGFLRTGFSFFLGALIYRLHLKRPMISAQRNSKITSWFVIIIIMVMLTASPSKQGYLYIASVFLVFPAVIYAALAVEPGPLAEPIWKFLGDISYPIYTFHVPLYFFLCSVVVGYGGITLSGKSPWDGLAFMVTVVLFAFILDNSVDRPIQKRLRMLWPEKKTDLTDGITLKAR